MQVIPFRAKMVVDHIKKYHQTQAMRALDEMFQVLGPAVPAVRRERQHTVITPIAGPRKIRYRHQLDRGYSQFCQVRQTLFYSCKSPFRRKCSDVQLVDDRFFPAPTQPLRILPVECCWIYDLTRTVHIFRLKSRRGIRNLYASIDLKFIPGARTRIWMN